MSRSVFQPVGQKRLTNIAVVRYKKGGFRFEVACYKNKILNWRSGVESDLTEVVQTTTIFENVSKGILAKEKNLKLAFGTLDEETICRVILQKGEVQVSEKERKVEQEALFKDTAAIIAAKCINPQDGMPYTAAMIERCLKNIHFSVDLQRPAKVQALEAIQKLMEQFPIARVKMKLAISVPETQKVALESALKSAAATIEKQGAASGHSAMYEFVADIEPGAYHELQKDVAKLRGVVHLLQSTPISADPTPQQPETSRIAQNYAVPVLDDPPGPASASSDAPEPAAAARSAAAAKAKAAADSVTIYARGPICDVPEHEPRLARRKAMWSCLDEMQEGWSVELVARGGEDGVMDATFFAPDGAVVGAFPKARRQAMEAKGG